jgi:hypothetical protein
MLHLHQTQLKMIHDNNIQKVLEFTSHKREIKIETKTRTR